MSKNKFSALIRKLNRSPRFKCLGEGRTRRVYLHLTPSGKSTGYVLKVPLRNEDVEINWMEAARCGNDWLHAREHKAKCRMMLNNELLVMEQVTPISISELLHLPEWAYAVDCQQVGYTRDGRLVAYDYGEY